MLSSELVLAADGSLYHIHMTGADLADDVFLVGDPDRVDMFKSIFDSVEFESRNREIHALTGRFHGHRFTAMSTGMGCDNIDIILTELDAAANIVTDHDFCLEKAEEAMERGSQRHLNLVRIGTSGSLHAEIPCGSRVASAFAIGMDGLLNYYAHEDDQLEEALTQAFVRHMHFSPRLARPYAACCGKELLARVGEGMVHGITATAPGFYAPQGRHIRIAPSVQGLNERLASFRWMGLPVTNLEMESSAIYGLSRLMGHEALTVCLIIANRADGSFLNDYHDAMRDTIGTIMDRLV